MNILFRSLCVSSWTNLETTVRIYIVWNNVAARLGQWRYSLKNQKPVRPSQLSNERQLLKIPPGSLKETINGDKKLDKMKNKTEYHAHFRTVVESMYTLYLRKICTAVKVNWFELVILNVDHLSFF